MPLELCQAGDTYHTFHCIQVMHHLLGSDVIAHVRVAFSDINKVLKIMIFEIFGLCCKTPISTFKAS